MFLMLHFKDLFIVSSILGLFAVGLVITLKSGVVSMGQDRRRQLFNNFSHLVVALAGCLVFLLMVQQMVGFRISSNW